MTTDATDTGGKLPSHNDNREANNDPLFLLANFSQTDPSSEGINPAATTIPTATIHPYTNSSTGTNGDNQPAKKPTVATPDGEQGNETTPQPLRDVNTDTADRPFDRNNSTTMTGDKQIPPVSATAADIMHGCKETNSTVDNPSASKSSSTMRLPMTLQQKKRFNTLSSCCPMRSS